MGWKGADWLAVDKKHQAVEGSGKWRFGKWGRDTFEVRKRGMESGEDWFIY